MKKKLLLNDLSPGPLTGKPVKWLGWRIEGHMNRTRIGGVHEVVAKTAYDARHKLAIELGGVDPLTVHVELFDSNGVAK